MRAIIPLSLLMLSSIGYSNEYPFDALMKSLSPNATVKKVVKDEVTGMYLVISNNGDTFYSNESGSVVMNGALLDVKDGGFENRTNKTIANELFKIPADQTVQYSAVGDMPKGKVLIFFDTTCEYCRKLHASIPQIRAAGVEVRYLAYPRAGLKSQPAKALSQLWCSEWSREALESYLKSGGLSNDGTECSAIIEDQYAWGKALKLRGTPAIVFENGEVVNHLMKASDIIIKAMSSVSRN